MKKIIVPFILSLTAIVAMAQTNQYPNATGTITKSGYTYKYDSPKHRGGTIIFETMIQLHNASVSYLNEDIGNRDGTPLTEYEALMGPISPTCSGQSMTDVAVDAMIRGKFTTAQKTTLAGKSRMIVEVRIDTSTGKVADVYFKFFRTDPLMNIPVETYRSIELALKEKFTVTVTAYGKRRNYLPFSWRLEF